MIDIQAILNACSEAARNTRKDYHVTLGGLIEILSIVPGETLVRFDTGRGIGEPHSYRGYYADLALEQGEVCSAAELLPRLQAALGATYEGYKGGDFVMDHDTPLWCATYGNTGTAIVGTEHSEDALMLITKDVG